MGDERLSIVPTMLPSFGTTKRTFMRREVTYFPGILLLGSNFARTVSSLFFVNLLACFQDLGLTTAWDGELSYILTPALAAYELEHCTGVSAGNEEFQQAIRRAIPDGHTFKGFPIQFVHRNARRAFATCLRWVGASFNSSTPRGNEYSGNSF